jgi:hypothetical protein
MTIAPEEHLKKLAHAFAALHETLPQFPSRADNMQNRQTI